MPKNKHVVIRQCAGCFKRQPQRELLRLARVEGDITHASSLGRGVYLCKNIKCMELALAKRRLRRALGKVGDDLLLAQFKKMLHKNT